MKTNEIITILSLVISIILVVLFVALTFRWGFLSLLILGPLILLLATFIGFTSYRIDQCRKTGSGCPWGDAYKYLYTLIKSELSKL